jgi:hypothetical protein
MRPIALLESDAYRRLSRWAHLVLSRLEIEHSRQYGKANGNLVVTYDDLAAYGVRRKSIPAAIAELVKAGLVEITDRGFVRGGQRKPSRYRLSFLETFRGATAPDFRGSTAPEKRNDQGRRRPRKQSPVRGARAPTLIDSPKEDRQRGEYVDETALDEPSRDLVLAQDEILITEDIRITASQIRDWQDKFPTVSVKGEVANLIEWARSKPDPINAIANALAKKERHARASAVGQSTRAPAAPQGGASAIVRGIRAGLREIAER